LLKNLKLRQKFISIIIGIYIISLPVIIILSYYILKQNAEREMFETGKVILNAIESARIYTATELRPAVTGEISDDKFILEAMAGFHVANRVNKIMMEKLTSKHFFKVATINALNYENEANEFEKNRIKQFQENKSLKEWVGYEKTSKGNFYVIMSPIPVKQDCLKCHGEGAIRPKEIVDKYGTKGGYGWKAGDIQGASTVYINAYIPLHKAQYATFLFFLLYTIFFIIIAIIIDRLTAKNIIMPLVQFTGVIDEMSQGKMDVEFKADCNDEFKILEDAFTRLKISLVKAMEFFKSS